MRSTTSVEPVSKRPWEDNVDAQHPESGGCDRISPNWKTGFFRSQKSLDTVVAETLNLTEADERRIAAGLEARYQVSDLRAKHENVLDERDAAIALIKSRQGTRYIVDFERTKEFFDTLPRGKSVRLGVERSS